jgi:hypothetical protein
MKISVIRFIVCFALINMNLKQIRLFVVNSLIITSNGIIKNNLTVVSCEYYFDGEGGTRTRDTRLMSPLLYHLSYLAKLGRDDITMLYLFCQLNAKAWKPGHMGGVISRLLYLTEDNIPGKIDQSLTFFRIRKM